jgi:hypothetical protein
MPPLEMASSREVIAMTIQSDITKGRSLANFWAQLGLLTAVVVIVIAFAWQYVW